MGRADTIHAALRGLLRSLGHLEPRTSAGDTLTGALGLSSLDVLALVSRLNATFGVDPFAGPRSVTGLRTVGDLIRAYENACSPIAGASVDRDMLRTSAKRAELRRR
jgi:acyl carrier protein